MTPLRQRLIDDLRVRNYSPETIKSYVWGVAKLARHFGRSPDQLTPDDLRAFQVHLVDAQASWSQFNQITCGLRFFYAVTLGRPDAVPFIAFGKRPRRLPACWRRPRPAGTGPSSRRPTPAACGSASCSSWRWTTSTAPAW